MSYLTKNLYCRDTYWQIIRNKLGFNPFINVPGSRLRNCKFGSNCRGAHSEDELIMLPNIKEFEKKPKNELDLVSIYQTILLALNRDKNRVRKEDFKNEIEQVLQDSKKETPDFIYTLQTWRIITSYHRKIIKLMKQGKYTENEFSSIDQIPQFIISNEEDAWCIERLTKLCPIHQEMLNSIKNNKKISVRDLCCASINCKEGGHYLDEIYCNDDINYGECGCLDKNTFNSQKQDLENKIKYYQNKLGKSKNKKNFENKIKFLNQQYVSLMRKKHLTEEGLQSFKSQYKLYLEKVEKQKIIEQKRKELSNQDTENIINQRKFMKVKNKLKKPIKK